MRLKMSLFLPQMALFFKKYQEQVLAQSDKYRIIEIAKSPSGCYQLTIQLVGKSSIFYCSPEEILKDDYFLESFSKKDIRTITYLGCEGLQEPTYKIVSQEICEKMNKMIFKLCSKKSKKFLNKTANQIVMDENIINELSKKDLNSVSYIAGYECSQIENNEI